MESKYLTTMTGTVAMLVAKVRMGLGLEMAMRMGTGQRMRMRMRMRISMRMRMRMRIFKSLDPGGIYIYISYIYLETQLFVYHPLT